MPRSTDHSEMDLADLHVRVARGTANGRIIWQPRIGCWLTDREFAGEAFPPPYTGMTSEEIYRSLGCSARLYGHFNACFVREEDPRVHAREVALSDTDTETVVETPAGTQRWVKRRLSTNRRLMDIKRPIASPEEMRVATWRAEHATVRWDAARYEQAVAKVGDLGAPTIFMPRVNVQDLFINTMGVAEGSLALLEYPEAVVEAYFAALDDLHLRQIDLINASPIEIVNFGDNLHCATLPPPWFERWVLPAYRKRCEKLHEAGKFAHAHWDGDTKTLLPYARETGLDGIEAITPEPQGDVTLEEVREALGDDMFLIDGIPAVLFDTTFPERELVECAKKIIDLFAPRLILGISDEISSTGDLERIRTVQRVVDDYNANITG